MSNKQGSAAQGDDWLGDIIKTVKSSRRMILRDDTIGASWGEDDDGKRALNRFAADGDNYWAITTEELAAIQAQVDAAYQRGFDNAAGAAYQSLSGYYTQEQVDEAVREAKLVVLRGLPGKAPYVRPDGMMTTVDEIRTELLTTQSKSKENE